jgi:hypothetical protein
LEHNQADNDVEMDGGPVNDGDVGSRGQPALPPEKAKLCQYSGPVYGRNEARVAAGSLIKGTPFTVMSQISAIEQVIPILK